MRRGEGEGIPCLSQPLGSLGGKENPAGRLAPDCHHRGPPLASPVDRVPRRRVSARMRTSGRGGGAGGGGGVGRGTGAAGQCGLLGRTAEMKYKFVRATRPCSWRGLAGVLRPDELLKVDALQVRGAAVPAVQAPGAQQAGPAGAGVVQALPGERDLGREEEKGDASAEQPLVRPAPASVPSPVTRSPAQ